MRIVLIGINHRTAPVQVRETLAVTDDQLAAVLGRFRDRWPDCEAVVLSTCNRTELYIARPVHGSPTADELRAFLAQLADTDPQVVTASSIHREQHEAVRHLFRVSAGLDSMVLGESQVLGQVRRAWEAAAACDTVGPTLHRIFQQAVTTAKHLRTTTGIDAGKVSIASVAVDLAKRIFPDLSQRTVVGIGAGEMTRLTLRHLQRLSPHRLWLVNRSPDRATALAEHLQLAAPTGGARPWDDLDELLVDADIVLTSTASAEPVLTLDRMRPLIRRRRHRPLFLIDLAVPRDVEPTVASLSNVYLYNIDDLQAVVDSSFRQRRAEVERCEAQLLDQAQACLRQIQHRDVGRLIRQLRRRLHDIGELEQQRTHRKLASLSTLDDEAVSQLLDQHTHRIINKILHLPLSQLGHKQPGAPLSFHAAALRRLFNLDDPDH